MNGTTSSGFNPVVTESATVVRTLYKPKIDEIAAMTVRVKKNQSTGGEFAVEFHQSKYFTKDELLEANLDGIYTIDLGDDKYHGKTGSSTEMVVNDRYGGVDKAPVAVQKLVGLANKNNQNGHLKAGQNRIAQILRELYELEDGEDWHLEVVAASVHVVSTWIDAYHAKGIPVMDKAVQALAEKFKANAEAPLSLGQYIRNMSLFGDSSEQILERLSFWEKGLARLAEARAGAKELYAQMKHDTFSLYGLRGILLTGKAANYFVAGCAMKDYRLLITRNACGNVTINARGFDLEHVYRSLALDEIGQWYLVPTGGQSVVMNGSRQYQMTPPTKKRMGEIIRLLRGKAVPHQKLNTGIHPEFKKTVTH